jgi:CheY-like chemotaxis protein
VNEATETHSRARVSILVVDDDLDIRYTLQDILEAEGYSVVTAENGAEALERLQAFLPALILLDLSMPVMSGKEFRTAQLQDPTIASIPTVVVTASGRGKEIVPSMNVAECLAKPVKLEHLLETVARYARNERSGT